MLKNSKNQVYNYQYLLSLQYHYRMIYTKQAIGNYLNLSNDKIFD